LKTDVIKKRNRIKETTSNSIGRGGTIMQSNKLETSGGGSGGRPIVTCTPWGNEKRQRRHSLTEDGATLGSPSGLNIKMKHEAAMVISGSLPNQQSMGESLRQVLLNKQQQQQQQRHGSFSGFSSFALKPQQQSILPAPTTTTITTTSTTTNSTTAKRAILPNDNNNTHHQTSLQYPSNTPTNINWMGLMAQQQQLQEQWQQLRSNEPTTTGNTLSLLTPNQIQQLIMLQQAAVAASNNNSSNP
jgi:hypothetical protein